MTFSAAGVLPKANYHGTDYYYFGHEKSTNCLTTFCGKKDKPSESTEKCAARELKEESIGVFKSHKISVRDKLKTSKKVANLACKQLTFIMRASKDKDYLKKFAKKRAKPGLKASQREMSKIIAISEGKLKSLVASNTNSYKGINFRGDTWGTLKLAVSSGAI